MALALEQMFEIFTKIMNLIRTMLQRQSPSSIKTQHLCRWVEYMEFLLLTETRTGAPRLLQEITVDLTTV